MSPAARFNALVASLTVVAMFFAITQLVPYVSGFVTDNREASSLVALLTSVGIYRLLATILAWLLGRLVFVKRLVFGPSFVHGTWVGWFIGHAGDKRHVVDHFEQDLDGLVIRGRSYSLAGDDHANWRSDATSVDPRNGYLTFTYRVEIGTRNATVEGISSFQFERKSMSSPPTKVAGYAHDLNDAHRIHLHEEKVSSKLLPWGKALEIAAQRFK